LVPSIDVTRSDLIVVDDIRMLPAGQEAAEAFYRITDAPTPESAVTSKSNLPDSTRSCPRPSPPPPWTGWSTTPHLVQTNGESLRPERLPGEQKPTSKDF
jgi:hypothetical protein